MDAQDVKPLYVRTDDFRLAHRLLSELKRRNLPAQQRSTTDAIEPEAYWFGTPEEVHALGGRGVAVELDDVAETVSTWLLSRQLTGSPAQLVVGLDPVLDPVVPFSLTVSCLESAR